MTLGMSVDNNTMANFWDGKPICRICLKVLGSSCFSYVNEDNIKEMMLYSIPEVDIYTSADPVICLVCVNMLINVYNFKKKCLNTEVILRTYRTRHHIDEDGEVELPKLIEELVRFNSYSNQQQYNKSLSLPFPPPEGTTIPKPETTCAENTVVSDRNHQTDDNLARLPPQQQSALTQMDLPQFYETQFDMSAVTFSDDPTVVPPNVPNIPENMSESNKHLLQTFPMHFMASNASSQLAHLNRHHLVNSNHNHPIHQPSFGPHVPTQQFINVVNMQMVNGNQGPVHMPVQFINTNNAMPNVVVPLMNVYDVAKNAVVTPPSAPPKTPPRRREKTTVQRPTDGKKVLKVALKRNIETHPIESKRRLVVELERCHLIPSSIQNEGDRSSECKQQLFQCVGCMYMTTSSKFFSEHSMKCANARKENRTNAEWKCTMCPYLRGLLSCKSCRFTTTDKTLLKRHETEDRIKCSKCTHMFCSEENLQKHMERHEKNTCPFCAYSPADRSNLRRHIFSHSPVQIPCEFCDYRHSSPHVLKSHLKKYHNSVGIEDLDHKMNMSMEELIQDIKGLIETTK
nr:unnamed protein product [Callosobruchus chinensis]